MAQEREEAAGKAKAQSQKLDGGSACLSGSFAEAALPEAMGFTRRDLERKPASGGPPFA
jgi:hypothetical protein